MFILFERNYKGGKNVVAEYATFQEAFQALKDMPLYSFGEADKDYPGCADAYLRNGRVLSIEPKDFVLTTVK